MTAPIYSKTNIVNSQPYSIDESGLTEVAWSVDQAFVTTNKTTRIASGARYACILNHTAAADDEPGVGVNFETYWQLIAEDWNEYYHITGATTHDKYLSTGDTTPPTVTKLTPSSGGGDVLKSGTPLNNQVAIWTGSTTIEGASGFTYDGSVLNVTGNVTLSGTVDGRDIATDGSNLDAAKTKTDFITVTQTVDLDQMETDIAALANGMVYSGDWDASAGSFPGGGTAQTGAFYYVSVAGTVDSIAFAIGDNIVATTDNASTSTYASNWSKHDQTDAVSAVVGLTGSISKSGLLSALNVEDGSTGDQTDAEIQTAADIITGATNTALGPTALDSLTSGTDNTAVGQNALTANTTGMRNVGIGGVALDANISGNNNNALGYNALGANETGSDNMAMGAYSLDANTTGNQNTAVGTDALGGNTTAHNNTAIGFNALVTNSTGAQNSSVGMFSLRFNTVGNENTSLGYHSMGVNTTGSSNVAVGSYALDANTTASNSTAIGYGALSASTGASNTALGYTAGNAAVTNTNCMLLGNNAQATTTSVSNEITLGDSSIATLRCQVTTITALSDERDKKDIRQLECGLDFINAMRPVSFEWDRRDGTKRGAKEFGFVAQELDEVERAFNVADYTKIVLHENPDKLEAAPMQTYPILIKAVQELGAMVRELQAEVETLRQANT